MPDFHIEMDPLDPEKPNTMSGRIVFDETPESWIGRSAGHLRSLGVEVDEHIPDCAVLEQCAGGANFRWVSSTIVIEKESKSCEGW